MRDTKPLPIFPKVGASRRFSPRWETVSDEAATKKKFPFAVLGIGSGNTECEKLADKLCTDVEVGWCKWQCI